VRPCHQKSAGIPIFAAGSHSRESKADTAEFPRFCELFSGLPEGRTAAEITGLFVAGMDLLWSPRLLQNIVSFLAF
jgi:hypothetical protein